MLKKVIAFGLVFLGGISAAKEAENWSLASDIDRLTLKIEEASYPESFSQSHINLLLSHISQANQQPTSSQFRKLFDAQFENSSDVLIVYLVHPSVGYSAFLALGKVVGKCQFLLLESSSNGVHTAGNCTESPILSSFSNDTSSTSKFGFDGVSLVATRIEGAKLRSFVLINATSYRSDHSFPHSIDELGNFVRVIENVDWDY